MTNRCRQPKGKYLEHVTTTRVRFQEVDSLQMVWHGHYLTYFEDARVAIGHRYGISYTDIRQAGLIAPVVHAACDYLRPAVFGDSLEILARLIQTPGAKLEFYFEVFRQADRVMLARGCTIQAFIDADARLLLTRPPFLREFYDRWDGSMLSDND